MSLSHYSANYFLNPSFWTSPLLLFYFFLSLTVVIFLRHLLFSFAFKWVVERWKLSARNLFSARIAQIQRELKWSILSSVVFSIMAVGVYYIYSQGYTRIYETVDEYSLLYFLISPFLILFLYECYYYWLHRWMHTPHIFKMVHKVHHQSIEPTVFASFSFHPLEAMLQFIFFPVMLIVLPVHAIALLIVFSILTISAVVNHSGMKVRNRTNWSHHFIGSVHHDLHHKEFKINYGLYLTLWDKWMGTNKND